VFRVGLTGGIGSGKTTVSRIFQTFGFAVYNADREAKRFLLSEEVMRLFAPPAAPDSSVASAMSGTSAVSVKFAKSAASITPITPKEIAAIVFSDVEKLRALNAIIHPLVMDDFEQWAASQASSQRQTVSQTAPFVLMESAIIYESNLQHHFDKIIFVDAPEELRIKRVMKRSNLSREEVLQRISMQISSQEALRRADFVIKNDESTSLLKQVQMFCLLHFK
jgi:dephospho-CoA kinase